MNVDFLPLSSLREDAPATIDWLLFSVSFEPRSEVIYSVFHESDVKMIGFFHANHEYIRPYVSKVRQRSPRAMLVPLYSDLPLRSFDAMRRIMAEKFGGKHPLHICLDITCFTREALAMLLVVLKHLLPTESRVTCLYVAAADYPPEKPRKGAECWMSRGIAEIRTILGYRGVVSLMSKTHLILLPGFETERAQSIVEALQPDRLSIGYLGADENVSPVFATRATRMAERLELLCMQTDIERIEFSAKNPYFTRDRITSHVSDGENTIVACLNSKVAMVGACMAAQANGSIQLIYAQPLSYNTQECPEPSTNVIRFAFE